MTFIIKPAYDETGEITELFSEYTQMLIENDPDFSSYLDLQHYDDELKDLTSKYGLPCGRLYIAKVEGSSAGCIALKRIDDKFCEMKRLYVRSCYRGQGIAESLANTIIKDAKSIGYEYMLLDTLPFLKGAIALYKKLGFIETSAYNNSPMSNSVYMSLKL